jgi:DNA-binding IclR family transcriptional regulator
MADWTKFLSKSVAMGYCIEEKPYMVNNPADGNFKVPALEKGLDALELVHSSAGALSLTEIARSCGRSVSEMQRVVPYLAHRGYFVRDARGLYRGSSKMFRIGNHNPPFRDLVANAMGPMGEYSAKTGEGIHLSVLDGGELLILADSPGTGYLRIGVRVGSSHNPEEAVSGRVLLEFSGNGKTGRFEDIRKNGHEYSQSHLYRGVNDLAVPVLACDGTAIAAVATSWLDPSGGAGGALERLLPELGACALRISESFESDSPQNQ